MPRTTAPGHAAQAATGAIGGWGATDPRSEWKHELEPPHLLSHPQI